MAKDPIKQMTKNAHGQFAAKAKKAGMSTKAYADKEQHAKGKLGEQARDAKTLIALGKKRRKK